MVEGLADKGMQMMAQLAIKLLQDKASRAEATQSVAERYGRRQVLLNQAARRVQACCVSLISHVSIPSLRNSQPHENRRRQGYFQTMAAFDVWCKVPRFSQCLFMAVTAPE